MRSNKSIGEIIRYFRLVKDYSQKDLAELLNITESTVSAWERGIAKPGVDIAYNLASEMQMSLEEFFFAPSQDKDSDHHYEIFDTVKLSRGYLDLDDIYFDLDEGTLTLKFYMSGLSVDAIYLESHIDISIENSGSIIKPIHVETIDFGNQKLTISPELENIPLKSKKVQIICTYECKCEEPINIIIQENGLSLKYLISKDYLSILNTLSKDEKPEYTSGFDVNSLTKFFIFTAKKRPDVLSTYIRKLIQS